MNVLVLGTIPSPIRPIIENYDCGCIERSEPVDVEFLRQCTIDVAVSYRFRHIVKKPVIEYLKGKIINLHISLLPWNRGADPNLWSFLENTPKGVSIHYMDEGLDTGDIIAQKDIRFDVGSETLASTYEILNSEIIEFFKIQWPLIMRGECSRKKQPLGGTYHRFKDKEAYMHLLADKGWDTPVEYLSGKAFNKSKTAT
jgi:methionyl-tRNA formyltransferase